MGSRIVRYCCERPNQPWVFVKIVEGLSNFGLEKPLSVQSPMSASVGAWKIRMWRAHVIMEAWLVNLQGGRVRESFNDSIGPFPILR